MPNRPLLNIYHSLQQQYGKQNWWPADSPFEVMVGAILTQSTTWHNATKAIENLKAAGALSPAKLRAMSVKKIARLVFPSGYFNAKAIKLKSLAFWLDNYCSDDIPTLKHVDTLHLRDALLAIHGIGPETADVILLYAIDKSVFIIDTYTRRIFSRLGIIPEKNTYEKWQRLFLDNLPRKRLLFNEFHALLVKHAKMYCQTCPFCPECCLFDICPYAQAN